MLITPWMATLSFPDLQRLIKFKLHPRTIQGTKAEIRQTCSRSYHCNRKLNLSSEEGRKGQTPTQGYRKLCYQWGASDRLQAKQAQLIRKLGGICNSLLLKVQRTSNCGCCLYLYNDYIYIICIIPTTATTPRLREHRERGSRKNEIAGRWGTAKCLLDSTCGCCTHELTAAMLT